jgi:hypothetical protein
VPAIWRAFRRLSLGLVLIFAAATVLLLSDLGHRRAAEAGSIAAGPGGSTRPVGRPWQVDFIQ